MMHTKQRKRCAHGQGCAHCYLQDIGNAWDNDSIHGHQAGLLCKVNWRECCSCTLRVTDCPASDVCVSCHPALYSYCSQRSVWCVCQQGTKSELQSSTCLPLSQITLPSENRHAGSLSCFGLTLLTPISSLNTCRKSHLLCTHPLYCNLTVQLFNSQKPIFRMYNNGPVYDLTKVKAKVVMFSGAPFHLILPSQFNIDFQVPMASNKGIRGAFYNTLGACFGSARLGAWQRMSRGGPTTEMSGARGTLAHALVEPLRMDSKSRIWAVISCCLVFPATILPNVHPV